MLPVVTTQPLLKRQPRASRWSRYVGLVLNGAASCPWWDSAVDAKTKDPPIAFSTPITCPSVSCCRGPFLSNHLSLLIPIPGSNCKVARVFLSDHRQGNCPVKACSQKHKTHKTPAPSFPQNHPRLFTLSYKISEILPRPTTDLWSVAPQIFPCLHASAVHTLEHPIPPPDPSTNWPTTQPTPPHNFLLLGSTICSFPRPSRHSHTALTTHTPRPAPNSGTTVAVAGASSCLHGG